MTRQPASAESGIAVAFSGGPDSTALLHLACRVARQNGWTVLALHVHHGLQVAADTWEARLRRQICGWARRGYPVSLLVHRVSGKPPPGASVEAWARKVRYAALTQMANSAACSLVLLGHHAEDQAETFLLQALRGGGAQALAGMPKVVKRHGVVWARPLLTMPRSAIESYLARHRLSCIQDPTNAQTRFARSRLRVSVWPRLLDAFPLATSSLVGSASRLAVEADTLRWFAERELLTLAEGTTLSVARWRAYPSAVRHVLLRHWLRIIGVGEAPQTLVARLCDELPGVAVGTWPVRANGTCLRLYRGQLRLATVQAVACPVESLDLSQPGDFDLPSWNGTLHVRRVEVCGLDPASLRVVRVAGRESGHRFQLRDGHPARSLKKQYQDAALDKHYRQGPYFYVAGDLAFVAGLGTNHAWASQHASRGPGLHLSWSQSDASSTPVRG